MSVEKIEIKQPLSDEEKTKKEIEEILALTSTGIETKEQRTKRNILLREKLSDASNLAVVHAASKLNMEGLVGRELIKQLKDGENIPQEPLLEYVNDIMLPIGIHTKAQKKYTN